MIVGLVLTSSIGYEERKSRRLSLSLSLFYSAHIHCTFHSTNIKILISTLVIDVRNKTRIHSFSQKNESSYIFAFRICFLLQFFLWYRKETDYIDADIHLEMSNLCSKGELWYLQTVDCLHLLYHFFSFPFNVLCFLLTYNRYTNTMLENTSPLSSSLWTYDTRTDTR